MLVEKFSCCLRHVFTAHATDSRKIAGQIAFEGGEVLISLRKMVPPARSHARPSLRSRIHEPFVFNSYEKAYKMPVHALHIVLKVPNCKELRDKLGPSIHLLNLNKNL